MNIGPIGDKLSNLKSLPTDILSTTFSTNDTEHVAPASTI